jgi:predicted transcriptional regulator of viral defense system
MKMLYRDQLVSLLNRSQGILTSKAVAKAGIPRVYLTLLIKEGRIERTARGIYIDVNSLGDEYFEFQARFSKVIFSHGTALFFHNMTEKTPTRLEVTVPSDYNPHRFQENVLVYRISRKNHDLGVEWITSPFGHPVKSTNLERTFCDLIRRNKALDLSLRNHSLRAMLMSGKLNEKRLWEYAKRLRCTKRLEMIHNLLP